MTAILHPTMELLDLLELLGYATAFWAFVVSPAYRRGKLEEFRGSGGSGRCFMLIEGALATLCGVMPLTVVALLQA